MKIYKILSVAAVVLMTISCGNSNNNDVQTDKRYLEIVDEETGICSLSSYSENDSLEIKGDSYKYTYYFHDVDSLPHIVYNTGTEYRDNEVQLTIMRNNSTSFTHKTFTKYSFKSYIPDEIFEQSGLIGFTYNVDRLIREEYDALYFIATIGNLDDSEAIAYPLEIRIDTDGGMTIKKYDLKETEPLRNGLNVDPSEDDGV